MPELPPSSHASLTKEHGIWVFSTGETTTIDILELIDAQRDLRIRNVMGLGEDFVWEDTVAKGAEEFDRG